MFTTVIMAVILSAFPGADLVYFDVSLSAISLCILLEIKLDFAQTVWIFLKEIKVG